MIDNTKMDVECSWWSSDSTVALKNAVFGMNNRIFCNGVYIKIETQKNIIYKTYNISILCCIVSRFDSSE